jgi:chitinase
MLLTITVLFAFCVNTLMAEVILEDSFDTHADWNLSGQHEGSECSVGSCAANTYPAGWNYYRTVPGATGLNPVLSIGRLPGNMADHTGTGTGKALIVRSESVPGANWPGDAILGKYFGASANYQELYIRFWIRTQPNWQFTAGGLVKVFRSANWRATDNIFQWANESTPIMFFDFAIYSGKANYAPSYRCDQLPYDSSSGRSSDYYCLRNDQPTNGVGQIWTGTPPTSGYADTNWHRYDFYIKMNTIGSANGIYRFSYDGTVLYNVTNVVWKESNSSAIKGWNAIALGGNSDNTWSATAADQWYAIDDLVVSTTPIPGNYVATPPNLRVVK